MAVSSFSAAAGFPPLAIRAWLRYDVVRRLLKDLRPDTILELGCGQGAMGSRLAARAEYLGVEPDADSYAVAVHRIEPHGGRVLQGTDEAVPPGQTFDLVCAFEVLEHLADDSGALRKWVRFVRPGGHLMLSVPAFQRRFGPMDTQAGHLRRYEPSSISDLLTAAGLTDPQVTVYGWPLGYALEAVRNRIDARKIAAPWAAGTSTEELTAASGRTNQPERTSTGVALQVATLPFRYVQRARPARGTGLVALARRRM